MTASILNQLVVNRSSKENSPKVRVDTSNVGGKVLNEAASRAIVQAKVDKKQEAQQKQIDRAEKAAQASKVKLIKLNETIQKNNLKLKNLKSGVGNKILTVGPPSERTKNNNYEEMDDYCLTCRQCSSKFVIGTSEGWLPCENCINWYCSLCVGVLQDEKCNYC